MPAENVIPESHRHLLSQKGFAHLATLNADGSPQSTPVWIDTDGIHVLVNSVKGRRKDRNMRERGRVALSITDPENPYSYLEIRGEVVEITEEGAEAHIDKLAERYPFRREGEVRVIYKIRPEHTTTMG
jgi:PPOX class probable F420-dependent enzyme